MASLRKPTVCVPKVPRRATAWDPAAVAFAPAARPCAGHQATTARSTAWPSFEGSDVDDPCRAI
jgi:hypothetical protein